MTPVAGVTKVGTAAAAGAPGGAHVVPAVKTKATVSELRDAITRALTDLHGKAPSPALVDALTGQASFETARGTAMNNFNFAGIKGVSPESGLTASYLTGEVIDGKAVKLQQGFRAYRSLDEGARDFVSLLERRYGPALEHAENGDVSGFVHALKKGGYFTGSEKVYASAVARLATEASGVEYDVDAVTKGAGEGAGIAAGGAPAIHDIFAAPFATSDAMTKVDDVLRASSARLAAPIEESSA